MDTTKSSATAPPSTHRKIIKKVGNEVWFAPATREQRKARVALAKAFLDTFGRD